MKRILLLAFVAIFVSSAGAQIATVHREGGPPGMMPGPPPAPLGAWWKNSDVVKELQLTDPQIKQIEQTFLDYRMKLIDLRADVEKQELRLQPLIEADRPDEQKVSTQVDSVLAARAKLEKTNTMMMLAIRRDLSVEQWKKLQAIQQKREGPFFAQFAGRMGPGEHGERNVIYLRRGPGGDCGPMPGPPGPGQPD